LPNLITFDTLTLKDIDKLQLINYSRNWRPDYALFEEVRIYDESKIVLIDSVFIYQVDDKGKRIDDSKKVTVYTERYKIDNNGKIIKIEN